MSDDDDLTEDEPEPIPLEGDSSQSYSEYLASLPDEVREAVERATGQWTREEAVRRWKEGNGVANPGFPP